MTVSESINLNYIYQESNGQFTGCHVLQIPGRHLVHAYRDTWVFNDGYDATAGLPDIIEWERPLAISILTEQRQARRLDTSVESHDGVTVTHFDFQDKLRAVIHASGEFTVDVEVGAVSLYEFFKQADRRKAYDLFRLVHLLRLYNLIVPQYIAPGLEVPVWPELPKKASERRKHCEQLKDGLRPLVLPRLRVLKQPDAIRGALNHELKEAAKLTEMLSVGKVQHEVTGFVRRLPKPDGVASDEAKRLAMIERGITLKPGQTYVRQHIRGTLPNPAATGHVAIVKEF